VFDAQTACHADIKKAEPQFRFFKKEPPLLEATIFYASTSRIMAQQFCAAKYNQSFLLAQRHH